MANSCDVDSAGMGATNLSNRTPWYRVLYLQVLVAVVLGIVVGSINPALGQNLKPLGDGFVKLVKMMIAPVIFCTIVHGIASMGDLKRLGRVGVKALVYFEIVSTFALVIGLIVVNVLKPGVGFTPNGSTFHAAAKAVETSHGFVDKAHGLNATDFLLKIIPDTFVSGFVTGDLLQVLLVAVLTAFAIGSMGELGKPILNGIELASNVFFGVMKIVVRAAPVGAFGAMAFTIGSYGWAAMEKLVVLMFGFYVTAIIFVVVVLGLIASRFGFSIFRFVAYIRDEILLVLGTSSSETALPSMLQKMQQLGCSPSTVGLVIPTGYSFNLDGTNIYMAMAAIFLAQATNTPLDLPHQIGLLLIAMITSKGASGVTGAGFIALAATIQSVPAIPIESLAILVGIDRFMSECRSITNLIGNGIATIVISRWENELTAETLNDNLLGANHGAHA